ncbi:MAG: hypothetical protein LBC84_10220 [Prevotellaceae bacterium]|jgi:major membrane immunogen (membrane-anchored lipoprotein)|nr:hypothetical protein [Prevotellaceae bacterium]
MNVIISNQRIVSLKRLLMIMAAIMMALVTFTACDDKNAKEDENGENGGGGGAAGKRLKGYEQTSSKPEHYLKTEWSYNSDGTLNRVNHYDKSSTLVQYVTYTNNSDGTPSKMVLHNGGYETEYEYFYNPNKTLQKAQVSFAGNILVNIEYTFENGKKIREVAKDNSGTVTQLFEYKYDNSGRRTTTTETDYSPPNTRQFTRTYNSDGTIQKVTYAYGYGDNTLVTITFTWENEKPPFDNEMFFCW